jgi:hypothetical protein
LPFSPQTNTLDRKINLVSIVKMTFERSEVLDQVVNARSPNTELLLQGQQDLGASPYNPDAKTLKGIAEYDFLKLVDPHLLAVCTLVPNFILPVPLDHPSFSSI